jgi:hypothetical protein
MDVEVADADAVDAALSPVCSAQAAMLAMIRSVADMFRERSASIERLERDSKR